MTVEEAVNWCRANSITVEFMSWSIRASWGSNYGIGADFVSAVENLKAKLDIMD